MSQQRAMWARRIGQVCGEACGRMVAEEVRGMLEDGLSAEEVAEEAGRVVKRAVLRLLCALPTWPAPSGVARVVAVNEDGEREEAA